jgi:hypothetical protein
MIKVRSLAIAAFILSTGACASIMHGNKQGISVNSTPTGASVVVDGQPMGTTPAVLQLARKSTHVIQLNLDGYQPYEIALTRGTSGWVWGNIVFGGLIGLGVDAATGSLYKLSPETITADMQTRTAVIDGKQTIQIAVVMTPDPSWQKIGQLQSE